jgi:ribosomal protein S18 acetylase RimI-like enzyme
VDAGACEAIVDALPNWFGLEEGRQACSQCVREERGLVAEERGAVVGFVTWRAATPAAAEISWLAVRPDRHRAGAGRALVEEVARQAQAAGLGVLTVWTLSARDPDPFYAATRAFYAALGFVPVAEADIWGPDNPAALLARGLTT